ncbi:hypothetical protein CJ178_09825 [Rhodococcus sp. ACPA4]|jgi:hypothetical protein|uniref:DUF6069 family protein n=1 Tax=Rhodococcus TaxID=1827 RepID=UPI0005D46230|nr:MULTISPECIES: DUF6069 family protein [Rhodococcus]KJF20244.1 hypothetical protein SZ00_05547 [Rhodococcus sp. AD45]PBC41845.1 hypothetical protein CJ178_09825 [Rhodococcus sp. ACPA4]PSR41330.1 hypothetical protein C7T36_03225 [Rhodococcus sp. AD45-ID]QXW04067.1 hypothetical protein KYT97_08615 [Rhodococcus globerulus]RZL22478.1 MAG: hypothetical protein EOP31_23530 [Rhodococcus sp. (in: high G+C Gram-positive bacteria)]
MSQIPAGRPTAPTVNATRLWAGGAATALVAALTAVVGLLIVRGLLDTPVITPATTLGNSQTGSLAVGAAVAALVATALLHVLIVSTPRASNFFGWIGMLATIAATLWPFTVAATTASKIGSAAIYFTIGIAIVSLLTGVAASART